MPAPDPLARTSFLARLLLWLLTPFWHLYRYYYARAATHRPPKQPPL